MGKGRSRRASGTVRYIREVTYNYKMPYFDAIIYQVKAPRRARRALGKPTTEAQAIINERHAKLKLLRKANANFEAWRDICVHLTFSQEYKPEGRAECKALMVKYIRRLKNAWKTAGIELPFKWLYVIEGEDGHRIHVHMLMTGGLPAKKIKELWGMAEIVNVNPLQPNSKGYEALAVYLTKQGKLLDGEHRWYCSRNLVDPEREEQNAKIPMDEAAELGRYIQDEMYANEGTISTAERFKPIEERYPGYFCADADAKYLEQFREWVIHIQLYRKDTPAGLEEAGRRRDEAREIVRRKKAMAARRGEAGI